MALNINYIYQDFPSYDNCTSSEGASKKENEENCAKYNRFTSVIGQYTLNNITEYECIFRNNKREVIHKSGYIAKEDESLSIGNLFTTIRSRYGSKFLDILPEHWSRTDITSNSQPLYNDENYAPYIKDYDELQMCCVIQTSCVAFSIPSLSSSIIEDYKSTKILDVIRADNEDIKTLINALKTQIDRRFASPKYQAVYRENNLTSLSAEISEPEKGEIIKQLKALVTCVNRLQGTDSGSYYDMRTHDQYPRTEISTPNNIIQTTLIKDIANAITYDMQDCICYSDCNEYSVCWCYGNCNYY